MTLAERRARRIFPRLASWPLLPGRGWVIVRRVSEQTGVRDVLMLSVLPRPW